MVLKFLKCVEDGLIPPIVRNRDSTERGFPVLKSINQDYGNRYDIINHGH